MLPMDTPLSEIIPPLTSHDRCDRCGAQAFVAVLLRFGNDSPLTFCGHHAREYEPALAAAKPFAVRDDRYLLEPSPQLASEPEKSS